MVSIEGYEQVHGALDDLIDITTVASRMLTAGPERVSLDEVLARFGYTREEIAALQD